MATTDFPSAVKIGPYRFVVEAHPRPFASEDERHVLSGEIDHSAGVIRLYRNGNPEREYTTFWHEVLHGIDDLAGTDLGEDTVNRLAPVLAQVLMENGFAYREEAT